MIERTRLLADATEIINGDRNVQYGEPSQDFERTALLWTVYLSGRSVVQSHDVAAMMCLLKLSRITWSPEVRDHWVDLAGYAACGFETTVHDGS